MFRFREFLFLAVLFVSTLNSIQDVAGEDSVNNGEIAVRFVNGCGVFNPHEVVALEVFPRSPKVASEKLNQLVVSLHRSVEQTGSVRSPSKRNIDDSTKISSTELEVTVPDDPRAAQWIPISLTMPATEGVYRIAITFQRKPEPSSGYGSGYNLLVNPLQRRPAKVVVQSEISCVVVNAAPIHRRIGKLLIANDKEQPETVDTANPAWWKRLTKVPAIPKVGNLSTPKLTEFPKIPGLRLSMPTAAEPEKSPLHNGPLAELLAQWKSHGENSFGSGHFKQQTTLPTIPTPLSALTASGTSDTVPWEAIPLAIKEPGKPHLLELEYPSGVVQTLGIGVVELLSGDSGMIPMLSVDSGIDLAEELVADETPNRILTHRIVFWPKTKSPMLLLTNRHPHRDAVFGKVNTFQLAEEPEKLPKPFDGEAKRQILGFVQRPAMLAMLASSTESSFTQNMVGPAEWETFYEGASRFVDLLQYGGYGGAMFVVAADGGSLYPSKWFGINATFQSPDGVSVGSDGQPTSKDVLELLARLFDREHLTLVPTIDFNAPIPVLEQMIGQNPHLAAEISMVGPHGVPLMSFPRTPQANGPYYNILHPLVQEAMLAAVKDLTGRYARHPSFGGVSILLTAEGFAQLTDLYWGIDDATIARFQRETNTLLPDEATALTANPNPNRFQARIQCFQTTPPIMESWIHWRARKIHEFYGRVAEAITESRPDATLYLAGGTMLDGASIQQYCQPSLQQRATLTQILRLVGFDAPLFATTPSITFLKPHRISVQESEKGTVYHELDAAEVDSGIRANNQFVSGTLFYHHSKQSGFAGPGPMIVPAAQQNRRRFIKELAQGDALAFVDGGGLLPLGEEESLLELNAAYRQLPKTPFNTFSSKGFGPEKPEHPNLETEKSLQPLSVRFLSTATETFVYLVNDAPFGVEGKLTFHTKPEATLIDVGGLRPVEATFISRNGQQMSWTISLKPYDFVAVRIDDPAASVQNVDVYRPKELCGPNGILKRKVDELGSRIHMARNGVPWNSLINPGFEPQPNGSTELHGWTQTGNALLKAKLDTNVKLTGNASLKLESTIVSPTDSGVVWSSPLTGPRTGRLFTAAFVGIPNGSTSLPLHCVLNAKHQGQPLYRSFRLEPMVLPLLTKTPPINGVRWQKVVVPFDRLPQEHLDELRIGFEMVGPGTVWIDDVGLYQVAFTKEEQAELYRLVSVADFRCSSDRISDLFTLMEGYWPRFLTEHVPLPAPIASAPPAPVVATGSPMYTQNKGTAAPSPMKSPQTPAKPHSPSMMERFKGWFQ